MPTANEVGQPRVATVVALARELNVQRAGSSALVLRSTRVDLQCLRERRDERRKLVDTSHRRYFGVAPCGVCSYFLIVLRDRLVSLEISLIDLPSRIRMPRILPINAMVITSVSPATKVGRVGCSPWSIFGRHHPR